MKEKIKGSQHEMGQVQKQLDFIESRVIAGLY